MQLQLTKTCSKCGETKPSPEFPKASARARTRDGLQSHCKICQQEYTQRWRKRNPAKVRQHYSVQHRRPEDPDTKADRWRRYYAANRERLIAKASKHQAIRQGLKQAFTEADVLYKECLRSDPCVYCEAPMEHVDHIVPLHRGGSGGWENLTASCRACNQSKGTTSLLAFLARD